MGGAMAQIRSEGALIQSINPPLSIGGHTPGSNEGIMTLKELTDLCTTLLQKVLDLENVKTAQAKEIASLKKRITKLEQRQSSRFSGFHPFRAGASKRNSLGRKKVSKQARKNLKSQQMFQDNVLDKDADTQMIIKDKDNGEKGGSIAETIGTARPDISAARPEMKNQKAKEKGIAFKDADDSARLIRSIKTLQPLPTIDPKDKGKGILQESEPVKKTKKKDQDQIERDAEVALKIQAHLNEEARIERERQEEASKTALAEMYDEVQAQIDDDHELAVRLTLKEQENYTFKERFTHAQLKSRSFEEIHKLYIKEQKWVDAFVPIGSEENKKRIRSRKKRAAGSRSKHKSPKKQKVNDQDFEDSNKEHRKCLKVVLDDDKAINYETLDVKSLIVDCESQVLGTNKAGDVHVYKLTRHDGSYKHFLTFSRMLEVLDRQDVLDLHKIIMKRFLANDPEEKRYLLTKEILKKMLSSRLEAETKNWGQQGVLTDLHRGNSSRRKEEGKSYTPQGSGDPVEIGMPTLRTMEVDMIKNDEALGVNLNILEEKREHAAIQEAKSKAKMEKYYNDMVRSTSFRPRDLVYRNNEQAVRKIEASLNLSGRENMKSRKKWAKERTSLETATEIPFREHGTSATLRNVICTKCKHLSHAR
nr:reverse transcriptase domain-containing protein [Tanacetum cinerariifolium]